MNSKKQKKFRVKGRPGAPDETKFTLCPLEDVPPKSHSPPFDVLYCVSTGEREVQWRPTSHRRRGDPRHRVQDATDCFRRRSSDPVYAPPLSYLSGVVRFGDFPNCEIRSLLFMVTPQMPGDRFRTILFCLYEYETFLRALGDPSYRFLSRGRASSLSTGAASTHAPMSHTPT